MSGKVAAVAREVQVSEEGLERVRTLLKEKYHPRDHEEAQELILMACQDIQHILGWVSPEAARLVGEHFGTTENRVFGLLTFYADFRTQPPGNHFMLLCHGTACYVGGSQRLIDELRDNYGVGDHETTADGELTVQIVNGCLGVCDIAPVIHLDHVYHGDLDVPTFRQTIEEAKRRGPAGGHHEAH